MREGGRIVGCLCQPEPSTSTSNFADHHSNDSGRRRRRRRRHRRHRLPILTSPGLTSPQKRRASNSSLSSPSTNTTSAHAQWPPPTPRLTFGVFPTEVPECFSSQCGHRRLGRRAGGGGERGGRWVSAHHPSVVVSWLRAAAVE
ncbi:hypothetical protein HJG60_011931 [Phyllostomus discolor]|uniref:Uncharacterized protein n=1 Tax=Phyllostomus discolor TaxID=89673 RepID=A0A834DW21_9CHIR|nr:hypothetical protein HJG60_011931 [Phyllostomus discolor]